MTSIHGLHIRLMMVASLVLFATGPAAAFDNDPAIHRLCVPSTDAMPSATYPCGASPTSDQARFRLLMREYGLTLAPQLLQPAESMGINGFKFDSQFSVTAINDEQLYWQSGIEDETPPGALIAARLGVRKGLPASFDVGMSTTYLVFSELWAVGLSAKWSMNESVQQFPVDIAVRGNHNRIVGATDLSLTVTSFDLIFSRTFGAGGVASISPYLSYSPTLINASTGVVDSTPGVSAQIANGNDVTTVAVDSPRGDFVFSEESMLEHRVILGSRFIMGRVNLAMEVAMSPGGEAVDYGPVTPTAIDTTKTPVVQTYSINLGLDM